MKKLIVLASVLSAAALFAAPQVTVTSVDDDTGGRRLDVFYSVSESAIVTFDVLTNGVSVGGAALRGAVGEVYRKVDAGANTITWAYPAEFDGTLLSAASTQVRVTAWPLDAPPDYMVCNLTVGHGVNYYPSVEALPYAVTDDVYKTEYLVMRRVPANGVRWYMGTPDTEIDESSGTHPAGEKRHWVTFTNDYYIAIYELTQGQFRSAMGDEIGSGYYLSVTNALCPVDGVRWSYTRGANSNYSWPTETRGGRGDMILGRISTKIGFTVDLPTDAEWEYAARAGRGERHYDRSNSDLTVGDLGWYSGNADGVIHPVGLKQPNPLGLYDMYGNVHEWCLDWYTDSLYVSDEHVAENPTGPAVCDPGANNSVQWNRVTRGGGVDSAAGCLRSGYRRAFNIGSSKFTGIRVVAPAVAY